MIEINTKDLRRGAECGKIQFIEVFVSKYRETIGVDLSLSTMELLTGSQHTLLAYYIFRKEMLEGGFCQLIQNGYGPYIFNNPFAKVMRLWGVHDFSKLLYKAKKIYDKNQFDLESERNEDDFMGMYEQYENLNDLDDEYIEKEEEITNMIAHYVDEHIEDFAKILE